MYPHIKDVFTMKRAAGTYAILTIQGESVQAFMPHPLPPAEPELAPSAYADLNHQAELALARLSGVSGLVPSVDWLLYGAIRKEALLTSQIEGTQATLIDLFDEEAGFGISNTDDVEEVTNYLRAFRLVQIALVHAQFGTILPFLDGNGRIGRLLIAALLEQWRRLPEPLLYLSGYLKQHQAEYYRRLSIIRTEGDWESWVAFFLEGVATAAADAERSVIASASLIATDRRRLLDAPKTLPASYRLFEMLPMMPRFTIERVRKHLGTSFPTAAAAVKILEDLGIVTEMTGQKKNRSYGYQRYIELLSADQR